MLISSVALALGTSAVAERRAPGANLYHTEGLAQQLLVEHNTERSNLGVPALEWNSQLARDAQVWAQKLAREGGLRHASKAESGGAGENLWMGTAGYFAPEAMIRAFVEEKRHYHHAVFPNVSRTGSWQDVGHYTQVVWRDTREVGCAIAEGGKFDVLVCRYWPSGNWMGRVPY